MAEVRNGQSLRVQLRYVLVAWLFGAFWLWTISGAALTRFARELSMPNWGFGLMGALPHAGALFQLLTTVLLARYGHRKRLFIGAALIARLSWVAVALLPWVLPIPREHWWIAMLMMMAVAWIGHHISVPAWMDWMADVIPQRVRGRFWGVRSLAGQPVALVAILGAGFAIDSASQLTAGADTDTSPVLLVTSLLLAAGGLVGCIDILLFLGVKDPTAAPPEPTGILPLVREVLADDNFRRYLAVTFSFTLGIGLVGQYVWLYVFDELGWSNWFANLMLLAIPLMVMALSYRAWGRAADRHGSKNTLVIASFLTTFGSLGWLVISREHIWFGYTLALLATAAWPGVEIANLNILLALSRPKARRNGLKRRATSTGPDDPAAAPQPPKPKVSPSALGSAYIAVNSVVVAVTGIVAGLIAAQTASSFSDLRIALPVADLTFSYHSLLFLLSAALRLLGAAWATTLIEPAHGRTRDALRFMSTSLYNNMTQAILMPTRVVGRLARWTYRVEDSPPRRRK